MPYISHSQMRTYIPLEFDSLKPFSGVPNKQKPLRQDTEVWLSSFIDDRFCQGQGSEAGDYYLFLHGHTFAHACHLMACVAAQWIPETIK
ncbi:aspartate aminotransferase family protein [Pseudomonas sp. FW306-02-F02-AA]|uniref:Uncharacterized protein n=1 Tax=Pseudomonas fluorescens TaxID=294 RepID=A0A0N9WQA3_PSEFL|nr:MULTISPECIES: hypothetical protein [Pseudomonas]ALI04200.1 hypothetical protein AO353_25225 [Pseudomonas fluorescens]PMZ03208.1 aspartate aminotransferase family protein [Pseudomonas sp. FW306-02-F02-AB]PMZ06358.1 aspartate aminotransferase family protein [Pseudomonas sp. FW306-02-H06C]PMZ12214.1 aspartate aminotransferase family protein [Pseudomonas sp. FW306-02-F02-AA]PMZ19675.1 aspartate aminotransferase family protein [Pseudomonas sp. FW306-02-F08-AA]